MWLVIFCSILYFVTLHSPRERELRKVEFVTEILVHESHAFMSVRV